MARNIELAVAAGLVVLGCMTSCATTPPPPAGQAPIMQRRLGDAMDEAGRRFRRASRAVKAGRWDLAGYDLHELDEIFEEDLAHSSWHGKPELGARAAALQRNQLVAMHTALDAHDRAAFAAAVADAARACNDCHKTADVAYIEISPELGAEVPVVETILTDE
jgi:hypothetical protein